MIYDIPYNTLGTIFNIPIGIHNYIYKSFCLQNNNFILFKSYYILSICFFLNSYNFAYLIEIKLNIYIS